MPTPRLIEITEVAIGEIDRSSRIRPVSQESVEGLKLSIGEIGLQSEVQLRRIRKNGKLRLMAGAHRIEAFVQLGRATIPAKIWDCTDDQARLIEIDDNLAHAELCPLDHAVFLAERKLVYERIYPETKRGAAGAKARWDATADPAIASFVTSAAKAMGVPERNVRRLVAAGLALAPDQVARLRASPRVLTDDDLEVIARCDTAQRYNVIEALAEGRVKSARAALKARQPQQTPASKPDAEFQKLVDAWTRAGADARKRFVQQHHEDLRSLVWKIAQTMPPAEAARAELERRGREVGEVDE